MRKLPHIEMPWLIKCERWVLRKGLKITGDRRNFEDFRFAAGSWKHTKPSTVTCYAMEQFYWMWKTSKESGAHLKVITSHNRAHMCAIPGVQFTMLLGGLMTLNRHSRMRKINFRCHRFPLAFHLEAGTADLVLVDRSLRLEGALLIAPQLLQQLILLLLLLVVESKMSIEHVIRREGKLVHRTSLSNADFSASRLFFISSITVSLVFRSSFLIFDRTSAAFNFLVWADNLC